MIAIIRKACALIRDPKSTICDLKSQVPWYLILEKVWGGFMGSEINGQIFILELYKGVL